jgi:hypothetical protein
MTNEDIKTIKDQCSYWKDFKATIIKQCKEDQQPLDTELSKINPDYFPYQIFL